MFYSRHDKKGDLRFTETVIVFEEKVIKREKKLYRFDGDFWHLVPMESEVITLKERADLKYYL